MPNEWLEEAVRTPAEWSGTMQGSGALLITLHTSKSAPGSIKGVTDWVHEKHWEYHLALDELTKTAHQYIPFNRAAMSLKNAGINPPWGSNKSGIRNIQICIIDYAKNNPFEHLSAWALGIIQEIAERFNIPLIVIDDGRNVQSWLTKSGIRGHKNAPAPNDHVDPGAIPANTFLKKPVKKLKTVQKVVRKGSRGIAVKKLQKALGIPVDGVFGSGTKKAVKKFQRSKKITPDGVVGKSTWRALGYKLKKPKIVKRIVRKGDKNAAVKKLQRALNKKFKKQTPVDGVFGAQTRRRVRAFQKRKGITPDGVVGRGTWRKLGYKLKLPQGRSNLILAPGAIWPTGKDGTALLDALNKAAKSVNKKIKIISGRRTAYSAHVLRMRYLNGTGNLAARCDWHSGSHAWSQCGRRPTSAHAKGGGRAVDAGWILNGRYVSLRNWGTGHRALLKYGLKDTVPSEAWHYSLVRGAYNLWS